MYYVHTYYVRVYYRNHACVRVFVCFTGVCRNILWVPYLHRLHGHWIIAYLHSACCLLPTSNTVLSRASPHGRSQLKRQNLSVGGYTENSLKWFNYPHAKAHPRCEVHCHGTEWTCIVGSSVIRWGQPDSGESCIMLQSGPTCSLLDKFPQHSVIICSMRILCCKERTLQTRPLTGVCEPLMPDVASPKVHQNNCSYMSSVDLPSDSLWENLA